MRWHPPLLEQQRARLVTLAFDADALAVAKAAAPADEMYPPEKAPHPLALLTSPELRPAPTMACKQRKAKPGMMQQRCAIEDQWGDHRDLCCHQLLCEAMLLENRRIRPTPGTVELGDHGRASLDPDLIYAVLVTIQCQDALIADQSQRLDRCNDHIWGQMLVWMRIALHDRCLLISDHT